MADRVQAMSNRPVGGIQRRQTALSRARALSTSNASVGASANPDDVLESVEAQLWDVICTARARLFAASSDTPADDDGDESTPGGKGGGGGGGGGGDVNGPDALRALVVAEHAMLRALGETNAADLLMGNLRRENEATARRQGLSRSKRSMSTVDIPPRAMTPAERVRRNNNGRTGSLGSSNSDSSLGVEHGQPIDGSDSGTSAALEEDVETVKSHFNATLSVKKKEYVQRKYEPIRMLIGAATDYAPARVLLEEAPIQDQQAIANILVHVFAPIGEVLPFLRCLVEAEVAHTSTSNDLFRANSPSTKFMKAFVLVGGREFLINSLGGLVDLVCQESTGAPVSRRRGTLAIAGSSGGENTTAPMPAAGGSGGAGTSGTSAGGSIREDGPLADDEEGAVYRHFLIARDGPLRGQEFVLNELIPVKVGRSKMRDNHIIIPGSTDHERGDDSVSKEHALIYYNRNTGAFHIRNISATNQIFVKTLEEFVDDKGRTKKTIISLRHAEERAMMNGELVRIGLKSKFVFVQRRVTELDEELAYVNERPLNDLLGVEDLDNVTQDDLEILGYAQRFLDAVLGAEALVPPIIREMNQQMVEIVGTRFEHATVTSVVGFFFLRFVCPAIVTPSAFGLVSASEEKAARIKLIKIAKLLQGLANFVTNMYADPENKQQDVKGPKSEAWKEFVRANAQRVKSFVKTISKPARRPERERVMSRQDNGTSMWERTPYDAEQDYRNLAFLFEKYKDSLVESILTHGDASSREDLAAQVAADIDVALSSLHFPDNKVAGLLRDAVLRPERLMTVSTQQVTKTLANCFIGREGIQWLRRFLPSMASVEDAYAVAERLLRQGYFVNAREPTSLAFGPGQADEIFRFCSTDEVLLSSRHRFNPSSRVSRNLVSDLVDLFGVIAAVGSISSTAAASGSLSSAVGDGRGTVRGLGGGGRNGLGEDYYDEICELSMFEPWAREYQRYEQQNGNLLTTDDAIAFFIKLYHIMDGARRGVGLVHIGA